MKHVRGFGLFLYDFIVGDSLGIGIGVPLAVLASWLLLQLAPETALPEVLLPAAVLVVLVLSLRPAK